MPALQQSGGVTGLSPRAPAQGETECRPKKEHNDLTQSLSPHTQGRDPVLCPLGLSPELSWFISGPAQDGSTPEYLRDVGGLSKATFWGESKAERYLDGDRKNARMQCLSAFPGHASNLSISQRLCVLNESAGSDSWIACRCLLHGLFQSASGVRLTSTLPAFTTVALWGTSNRQHVPATLAASASEPDWSFFKEMSSCI